MTAKIPRCEEILLCGTCICVGGYPNRSAAPLAKEEDLDKEVRNRIDLVHDIVDVKVGAGEVEFNGR